MTADYVTSGGSCAADQYIAERVRPTLRTDIHSGPATGLKNHRTIRGESNRVALNRNVRVRRIQTRNLNLITRITADQIASAGGCSTDGKITTTHDYYAG